jgi:hypothetical protein
MRRLGAVLVVVAAMVAGGEAAANAPTLKPFSDRLFGVSFSYPRQWRPQYAGYAGLHYTPLIVVLSTERLNAPCRSNGTGGTRCGVPLMLDTLPQGGVFVTWLVDDAPALSGIANRPGTPTRVGGLPAKIAVNPAGAGESIYWCPQATSRSFIVWIAASNHHGPVIMAACANTKNAAAFNAFKTSVRTMLRSVRFQHRA